MKSAVFKAVFISGLFLLLGCATTLRNNKSDPTQLPALEPAALLKFGDIPVPSTFNFTPEESYTFQSVNFRAGLLKYKGKSSAEQTIIFFKEQMPLYNWHLLNIVEYGRRMINLEKGEESCVITVDEVNKNLTSITIAVAPRSQNYPNRRADKPIK